MLKQGPIFSLELDLPGVTDVKFGASTKMLLVWARCFLRGVESRHLMFDVIQCESVHFFSFRWGAAKIVPEHCPWGGSGSLTWRGEGQGAKRH